MLISLEFFQLVILTVIDSYASIHTLTALITVNQSKLLCTCFSIFQLASSYSVCNQFSQCLDVHTVHFVPIHRTIKPCIYVKFNRNDVKICNFKKREQGSKVKKICKQVRIKQCENRLKIQLKGRYKMEINSKVFANLVLTASSLQLTMQQSEQGQ